MRGVWALVPIKCFTEAKTRLSTLLSGSERSDLARELGTHVLNTVLKCGYFDGVVVLTNDAFIETWSRRLGAIPVRDGDNQRLAETIGAGLRWVRERGGKSAVVVMGDLPFLSGQVLGEFLTTLGSTECVIGPDRRRDGTNILGLRTLDAPSVHFGERKSFTGHLDRMKRENGRFQVFESVETGFDVDIPADYLTLESVRRNLPCSGPEIGFGLGDNRIEDPQPDAGARRSQMTLRV